MKITIFTCIISLSCTMAFCQSPASGSEITNGPEIINDLSDKKKMIPCGDDGTFVFTIHKGTASLFHLDKTLKLIRSAVIPEQKLDEKNTIPYTCCLFGNKLYLFSYIKNKKARKCSLVAQEIDKNSLTVNNEMKNIASVTSRSSIFQFIFSLSPDKSKMLVCAESIDDHKYTITAFDLHAYSAGLVSLWEKEILLKDMKNAVEIPFAIIDNIGNAYTSVKEKYKLKGMIDHKFHWYYFLDNGKQFSTFLFSLNEKFVCNMQASFTAKGEPITAGFFSKKNSHSVKGVYYSGFDVSSKMFKKITTTEFPENILEKNIELHEGDTRDLMGNYILNSPVVHADGSMIITGEYYLEYGTYSNGTSTYHYDWEDILIAGINCNGTLAWSSIVKKKQSQMNGKLTDASYITASDPDKLFIIYNQNALEAEKEFEIQPPFTGDADAVVSVTIDNKGNCKKEFLRWGKPGDYLIRPMDSMGEEKNIFLYIGTEKGFSVTKVCFK